MKELNQGFYHAAAKALAKWWRPSSNSSRSEDIYACGTTTSATMQIQGRLKVFAGTGIRLKGSWSGGTRLHSPINSGRKLSGLNHRDKTISSWSSTGTGGYHSSKLNPILYGIKNNQPSVEKKIQKDGFIRDNFLTHLNEPRSGTNENKLSLGGKALIFLGLLPSLSIKDSDLIRCGGKNKKENTNAAQEAERESSPMVNFLSGVSAVGESLTNLVRNNITREAIKDSNEDNLGICASRDVISTPKKKEAQLNVHLRISTPTLLQKRKHKR